MHLCKNAVEKVNNHVNISGFHQLAALGSKIQQQMETYNKSKLTEHISDIWEIQNGHHRKYQD